MTTISKTCPLDSPQIEDHGTIKIWRCHCGFGFDAEHLSRDNDAGPWNHWACSECGNKDYGDGLIVKPNGEVEICWGVA